MRMTEDRQRIIELALKALGFGDKLNSDLFDRVMMEFTLNNLDGFEGVLTDWRNTKRLDVRALSEMGIDTDTITWLEDNIYKY